MTERKRAASRKKRKQKQWQATVDLPKGRLVAEAAPLVVRYEGRTHRLDSLAGLDLAKLEPARTFVSRAGARNKPCRPYLVNRGRHITVESETEAIEAHLADRDPDVRHIVPQGVWVKGLVRPVDRPDAAPRWGWSCVDFVIQYGDGTIAAVEVKRHGYQFKPRAAAKLLSTADACASIGMDYRLVSGLPEREWMVFYQLHSARRSWYRSDPIHAEFRVAMLELASAGTVTFAELRDLGDWTTTAALIWELLWDNKLCFQWDEPISSATPIRRHGPDCVTAQGSSAWDFICGPRRNNLLPDLREWAASW